eukprot:1157755-Pelagomonas_calceolata.AAC.4
MTHTEEAALPGRITKEFGGKLYAAADKGNNTGEKGREMVDGSKAAPAPEEGATTPPCIQVSLKSQLVVRQVCTTDKYQTAVPRAHVSHLIDQPDLAILILAELVLGVHKQEAPLLGLLLPKAKQLKRSFADLRTTIAIRFCTISPFKKSNLGLEQLGLGLSTTTLEFCPACAQAHQISIRVQHNARCKRRAAQCKHNARCLYPQTAPLNGATVSTACRKESPATASQSAGQRSRLVSGGPYFNQLFQEEKPTHSVPVSWAT